MLAVSISLMKLPVSDSYTLIIDLLKNVITATSCTCSIWLMKVPGTSLSLSSMMIYKDKCGPAII